MLLACTNCNTIFGIDRSAISAGRKVNCGVCKHVWIAYPENLIEEKHPKPTKQENNFSSKTDNLEKKIESQIFDKAIEEKPLISKEINRSTEFNQKKKKIVQKRKNFKDIFRWFSFGIFLSFIIIGVLEFYCRSYIVAYFPDSLKIYNLLKLEFSTNLDNLEIIDFIAEVDGDIMIVKGKIFNKGFLSELSPEVNITSIDDKGLVINSFKLTAENSIIKPKSYNHFRSEVFEYDNISSLNFYEFKAELSKEKFLFIK